MKGINPQELNPAPRIPIKEDAVSGPASADENQAAMARAAPPSAPPCAPFSTSVAEREAASAAGRFAD